MADPFFQILCVCKFTSSQGAKFDWKFGTPIGITSALTDRLDEIKAKSAKKFTHTVNWVLPGFWDTEKFKLSNLGPPELQPWDVIVYFVLAREASLARRVTKRLPPENAAGFTSQTPSGVISEVYLEGNFPAAKLGNLAMHELMHLKLDVGQTVVKPTIHRLNLGTKNKGISDDGIDESREFTANELRQMAPHLFDSVGVYKDGK